MIKNLTIIIPVYNQIFHTRKLLKSIAEHKFKECERLSVHVVDNASTDDTLDYLRVWIERDNNYFISNDTNIGFGPAVNIGVKRALETYPDTDILVLNNDMELLPDCIDELIKAAYSDSKIGIVGGKLLFSDGTIQHGGAFLNVFGWGQHKDAGMKGDDPSLVQEIEEQEYVTGACLFVKNALIKSLQRDILFDERFSPAYFEESVSGNRFTVVRDPKTKEIDVISFEELFERYSYKSVSFGNKDIIELSGEIETLCTNPSDFCLDFSRKKKDLYSFLRFHSFILSELRLSSNLSKVVNCIMESKGNYVKVASQLGVSYRKLGSFLSDILQRVSKVLKERIEGEFKPITKITRHSTNKQLYTCRHTRGETVVTKDHSLLVKRGNEFISIKPLELSHKEGVSSISVIRNRSIVSKIDFSNLIKKITKPSALMCDDTSYWEGRFANKRSLTSRFPKGFDLSKDRAKVKALCRFLGAFVSEGSSTSSLSYFSICNTNKEWLDTIKTDLKCFLSDFVNIREVTIVNETVPERVIEGKKTRFINSLICFKIVCSSKFLTKIFREICGEDSSTKKIPSFIFSLPTEYQREFLKTLLEGDGWIARNSNAKHTTNFSKGFKDVYFTYQTKSLRLISGLCFLLTLLGEKYGVYIDKRGFYSVSLITKFFTKGTILRVIPHFSEPFVYDLEVDKYHNFVDACGLILLHNTDFCFEARKLGYKTIYAPKSQAIHYENITGKAIYGDLQKVNDISRENQIKFYLKHEDDVYKYTSDNRIMICSKIYGEWSFCGVMRNLAKGLSRNGVDVCVAPEEYHNPGNMPDWEIKQMINKPKDYWNRYVLRSSEGDHMYLMPPGLKRIAHTTGENSRANRVWVDQLNNVDQVITTSNFFKGVLHQSGVKTPIYILPNSVDINKFNLNISKTPVDNLRSFNFLSVFHFGDRKAPEILFKAFIEEFDADEDVTLTVHSLSMHYVLQQRGKAIKQWLKEITPKDFHAPIFITMNYLSDKTMPRFIRNYDVFVLPSRGEGFCLLEDSKIITKEGVKLIKDCSSSDEVLTHLSRFRQVTKLLKREYKGDLIEIHPFKNEILCTTLEHPIYVCRNNKYQWIAAKNLIKSDLIVTSNVNTKKGSFRSVLKDDKMLVKIKSLKVKKGFKGTVYNLEVKGDSSYTANNIVVHNCLPPLEAGACGVPSIVTGYSGVLDYIDEDCGWKIDYKLVDIPLQVLPYFKNYIGGQWAEPSVEHLRHLMRHVYENRDEVKKKAEAVHKKAQAYSIENIGALAAQIIFE